MNEENGINGFDKHTGLDRNRIIINKIRKPFFERCITTTDKMLISKAIMRDKYKPTAHILKTANYNINLI